MDFPAVLELGESLSVTDFPLDDDNIFEKAPTFPEEIFSFLLFDDGSAGVVPQLGEPSDRARLHERSLPSTGARLRERSLPSLGARLDARSLPSPRARLRERSLLPRDSVTPPLLDLPSVRPCRTADMLRLRDVVPIGSAVCRSRVRESSLSCRAFLSAALLVEFDNDDLRESIDSDRGTGSVRDSSLSRRA